MYYLPLSVLELEILGLLAFGKTASQIAIELHLSKYAVRKNIKLLNSKLFVANHAQAIVAGVQLGLIEPKIEQLPYSTQVYYPKEVYKPVKNNPKIVLTHEPWSLLTEREIDVLLCFADGQVSNTEIAIKLFVTYNTVRGHLRRMYKKLNIKRFDLPKLANTYMSR